MNDRGVSKTGVAMRLDERVEVDFFRAQRSRLEVSHERLEHDLGLTVRCTLRSALHANPCDELRRNQRNSSQRTEDRQRSCESRHHLSLHSQRMPRSRRSWLCGTQTKRVSSTSRGGVRHVPSSWPCGVSTEQSVPSSWFWQAANASGGGRRMLGGWARTNAGRAIAASRERNLVMRHVLSIIVPHWFRVEWPACMHAGGKNRRRRVRSPQSSIERCLNTGKDGRHALR